MPSPKIQTTGDSDDPGVGTVLIAFVLGAATCLNGEWL